MMYLHAISPVHTGTGQAVDVIDLPVAREATTNWPYVPGSSIRGVLRTLCRPDGGAASGGGDLFTQAFGPESAEDTDAAGALLFGDGCLLCLPVRSLFGVFAWVSCPLALDRYRRDHASAALATPPEADLAGLAEGEIALTSTARVADDGKVYLEDLDLTVSAGAASVDELDRLAEHIARSVFDDGPWRGHFTARFGVVGDTTFSFLTETATEVTARIKLKDRDQDRTEGRAVVRRGDPGGDDLQHAAARGAAQRDHGDGPVQPRRRAPGQPGADRGPRRRGTRARARTTWGGAAMTAQPAQLTRQQRYLTTALDHVTAVKTKDEKVRKIYGGLCHSFPVLVRACGLCQALAFVEAKATGKDSDARVQAYRLLREHVAALLGRTPETLLQAVRKDGMLDYMRHTRAVLAAWIYYKRFAVSILKVESARDAEDEGGSDV